jgi:hypothetical protein
VRKHVYRRLLFQWTSTTLYKDSTYRVVLVVITTLSLYVKNTHVSAMKTLHMFPPWKHYTCFRHENTTHVSAMKTLHLFPPWKHYTCFRHENTTHVSAMKTLHMFPPWKHYTCFRHENTTHVSAMKKQKKCSSNNTYSLNNEST